MEVLDIARSKGLRFSEKMSAILSLSRKEGYLPCEVGILLVDEDTFLSCTEVACRAFGIKPNSYNKNLRQYGKAAIILSPATSLARHYGLDKPNKWNLYTIGIEGGIKL